MTTATLVLGHWRRLAGSWAQPLVRTAHVLVANAVLNAALGLGYWLLAARLYPPAVLGINAAAISAMMLLAGLAQLNLMSALLRFVPTAGPAAGRMIRGAYLIGGALSALAALIFLAGLRAWAPDLTGLLHPGLAPVAFVVVTACWALFVMQDNVLVALGRPGVVPVTNTGFGALKIALLPVLVFLLPHHGIWLSWALATAVITIGTTAYVAGRAVPALATQVTEAMTPRELRRFVGIDYLGALAWIAASYLVPLLVLNLTDPARSAVFALAWSICIVLYHVPSAFGLSLVANGVLDQSRLDAHYRQALRHTFLLLVPLVGLVVVFAPVWLGLFSDWYVTNGTDTLRLLALSAIPNAVVALAVSRARVARRMRVVVAVLTGICALVIGLTVVLVPRLGIVGAAIAWLTAQLIVAAAVLACRWRAVSGTELVITGTGVRKSAETPLGKEDLRRERAVLSELRARPELGGWRDLLPVPLDAADGSLLTNRLPGRDLTDHPALTRLTPAVFAAIGPLHRLDGRIGLVTPSLLDAWVNEPARLLPAGQEIDAVVAELRARLAGRRVEIGWTHGDLHPGNVLVDEANRVCGLVDWSQARPADLPLLDKAFWLLTLPEPGRRRELGARVVARLGRPNCFTPAESHLLEPGQLDGRALLLLAWLRHVAGNLAKSEGYTSSPLWSRRNVIPVLRRAAR